MRHKSVARSLTCEQHDRSKYRGRYHASTSDRVWLRREGACAVPAAVVCRVEDTCISSGASRMCSWVNVASLHAKSQDDTGEDLTMLLPSEKSRRQFLNRNQPSHLNLRLSGPCI